MIKWLLIDFTIKNLALIYLLGFIFTQLFMTLIYCYFLKECFLLVFCGAEERGSVPYIGRLLRNGGGILHKCLTFILVKHGVVNFVIMRIFK